MGREKSGPNPELRTQVLTVSLTMLENDMACLKWEE